MSYIGKSKVRIGQVVSDKMDKTVVVAVETLRRHPLYKKAIRRTKKYKVHDEKKEAQVGDLVSFIACRPFSKEKKWRLLKIHNSSANNL